MERPEIARHAFGHQVTPRANSYRRSDRTRQPRWKPFPAVRATLIGREFADTIKSPIEFRAGRGAAWLARLLWEQEVASSNLAAPIFPCSIRVDRASGRSVTRSTWNLPLPRRKSEPLQPGVQDLRGLAQTEPIATQIDEADRRVEIADPSRCLDLD